MVSGHDSNADSHFVTRIMCVLPRAKKESREKFQIDAIDFESWPGLVNQQSTLLYTWDPIFISPILRSMLPGFLEHSWVT